MTCQRPVKNCQNSDRWGLTLLTLSDRCLTGGLTGGNRGDPSKEGNKSLSLSLLSEISPPPPLSPQLPAEIPVNTLPSGKKRHCSTYPSPLCSNL